MRLSRSAIEKSTRVAAERSTGLDYSGMPPRTIFVWFSLFSILGVGLIGVAWHPAWLLLVPVLFVVLMGSYDMIQTKHAIRRNFPVLGRVRYWFEAIRPEMQQYFVESNSSGRPFSRELRSLVYRRAKNVTDTIPFGTEVDVYAIGYQWMNHSLCALEAAEEPPRVRIGGP